MTSREGANFEVGQRLTVDVEKVAHGGHSVARNSGRVFFVRHAIPGEKVEIEVTSVGSSFLRADVVRVLSASPDRVAPPCQFSGPGGCGGCDFQHISPTLQRSLKADVIKEQFARIAKMEVDVTVEEVDEPTRWRTRVSGATDSDGKIGFYKFRSHEVVVVEDCLIADEGINFATLARQKWPANSRIEISSGSKGERTLAIGSAVRGSRVRITEGPKILHETINGLNVDVSQESFWQSHKSAPNVLVSAIRAFVCPGDDVLDLYGGVGLFTAGIIDLVGDDGTIFLIESSKSAVSDARRNFHNHHNVHVELGNVDRQIRNVERADLVILDPPREGAGKAVISDICGLKPRDIVYVACDPAALARDSAYLKERGYSLSSLRAFDLFPMTHHIECVAHFKASQSG